LSPALQASWTSGIPLMHTTSPVNVGFLPISTFLLTTYKENTLVNKPWMFQAHNEIGIIFV
jgi:hypothetical protein